MTTVSCNLARSIGIVTTEANSSTAIERSKLQLPVVISGFNYDHREYTYTTTTMSTTTTGSDDWKLPFSALNWRCHMISQISSNADSKR